MKYNILVIDDEEDIRNSIAGLLQDENYDVRTVENSDKALNAISDRLPDLILIDIWLENSKLDGFCLLYTSPSPRDGLLSRMPSSA